MKLFSVDAEVNGLYGQAFAIAFTIREDGKEVYSWKGRCPDRYVTDWWVREVVLPALGDMVVTHDSPEALEEAFWEEWITNKGGCTVIAHCGSPVESGLFRRCVERDLSSRQWGGPYPAIHDVATMLLMKNYDPASVDAFLAEKCVECDFKGAPHHPMYDAVAAAQVFEALIN